MANLPTIAITTKNRTDQNGAMFDAKMSALGVQLNALSPTANSALYKITQDELFKTAVQTVDYYMSIGRLSPYSILANLAQ